MQLGEPNQNERGSRESIAQAIRSDLGRLAQHIPRQVLGGGQSGFCMAQATRKGVPQIHRGYVRKSALPTGETGVLEEDCEAWGCAAVDLPKALRQQGGALPSPAFWMAFD